MEKLKSGEEDSDFVLEETSAPPKAPRKTSTTLSTDKLAKKARVKRPRKRTFHLVGRKNSMYKDCEEDAGEDEIPAPPKKKLIADAMISSPKPPSKAKKEGHLIVEVGEDVVYVAMLKASTPRARVFLYPRRADYDINLVNIHSFTRAMSQVKWSTGNKSSSIAIDLFKGPMVDLLRLAVKDLRSLYAIDPLLSFLKETFYEGCLVSLGTKSDLNNQEKGNLYDFSKGKDPICDSKERTLGPQIPSERNPCMTSVATSSEQIIFFLASPIVPIVVVAFAM
ncbi:La-related protein 6 [Hordeum vulgare]|nr:La-related protein 6 [Hordeum vulgare]